MATAEHEIPKTRPRALIVDDSQIARYVLCGQLMRLGFEVDAANSAESALKQLTGPLPDVVFMDHLLPGMNGLEAVRRLRSQPRSSRTPIVMYTAQDTETYARKSREAGADDVFVKTEPESALTAILSNLGLVTDDQAETSSNLNVLPIRGSVRPLAAADSSADGDIVPANLPDALEPVLDAHYEKLRRDLLAEFAILERYEERMRRELFTRVEVLTKRSVDRLTLSVREIRPGKNRRSTDRLRPWVAMAASILVAVGISLTIAHGVERRVGEIETQNAAIRTALENQTGMLEELRGIAIAPDRQLVGENQSPVEGAALSGFESGVAPDEPLEPPTAVGALVAELQGMGILGSVRIETAAGSFCVGSSAGGFRMESSGQVLEDCEVLPILLSTANW
jgi:CheY-like chemotaxis protein